MAQGRCSIHPTPAEALEAPPHGPSVLSTENQDDQDIVPRGRAPGRIPARMPWLPGP